MQVLVDVVQADAVFGGIPGGFDQEHVLRQQVGADIRRRGPWEERQRTDAHLGQVFGETPAGGLVAGREVG